MGCGCGIQQMALGQLQRAALERAANPAAAKLAGLTRGAPNIGGVLPTVTTAGAVADLKARINPQMIATDTGVNACADLDAPNRSAWKVFFASWQKFNAEDEPFFGSSNRWDNAVAFQSQLAGWQETLRAKCTVPGPVVVDENKPPDLSVVKWAAAAVIVAAVAYGVRTVLK